MEVALRRRQEAARSKFWSRTGFLIAVDAFEIGLQSGDFGRRHRGAVCGRGPARHRDQVEWAFPEGSGRYVRSDSWRAYEATRKEHTMRVVTRTSEKALRI